MIKGEKINPLEVFKVRRVEFCPPYFEQHTFPTRYNLSQAMIEWIEHNMAGRFYIGSALELDDQSNIRSSTKVAFEKLSEMSYFMLACPY